MREQDFHGPGDHDEHVARAVDGRLHRIWSTEGTRILLAVFGVLATIAWNGIKDDVAAVKVDVADVKKSQTEASKQAADVKSDIRNLDTRLTERVIKQVDDNTKDIEDHESRLQRLERLTPVP